MLLVAAAVVVPAVTVLGFDRYGLDDAGGRTCAEFARYRYEQARDRAGRAEIARMVRDFAGRSRVDGLADAADAADGPVAAAADSTSDWKIAIDAMRGACVDVGWDDD